MEVMEVWFFDDDDFSFFFQRVFFLRVHGFHWWTSGSNMHIGDKWWERDNKKSMVRRSLRFALLGFLVITYLQTFSMRGYKVISSWFAERTSMADSTVVSQAASSRGSTATSDMPWQAHPRSCPRREIDMSCMQTNPTTLYSSHLDDSTVQHTKNNMTPSNAILSTFNT